MSTQTAAAAVGSDNGGNLYGLVIAHPDSLMIEIYNERTKKKVSQTKYINGKKFISDIPKKFSAIKAVTLTVFLYQNPGFPDNLDFCKEVRDKLIQHKIRHCFVSDKDWLFSGILVVADTKITVNLGDFIIIGLASDDGICLMYCKFTENGYQKFHQCFPTYAELPENQGHKLMVTALKPKYILVKPTTAKAAKKTKECLASSNKLVLLDVGYESNFQEKNVIEYGKWIVDNSLVKFHLLPTTEFKYRIQYTLAQPILTAHVFSPLPISEFNEVPNDGMEFSLTRQLDEYDDTEKKELCRFSADKPGHRQKIILKIDDQHFPSFEVEPIEMNQITKLPEYLNDIASFGSSKALNEKIPVVLFYDSSSVICISKENGYEFLKEWNGAYGKQLLISFDKKKPAFCDDAIPAQKAKHSSVVFDFTGIMVQDPDEVEKNSTYGFKITKDPNNPILLEFDSYDGSRKAASPEFLLAMLLRQHLKAIEAETGVKTKSLVFAFFELQHPEHRDRITDALSETCELLKIDCSFKFKIKVSDIKNK